jgi:hypothetical protein
VRWCYSGVTVVSQLCYSTVTVVLQWCWSGVRVTVMVSERVTKMVLGSNGNGVSE